MPSFPILDGFECANPRGLVRLGNPLSTKPGSNLRAGDEIAQRKRPLSVAVGNMNDSSAKLEIRHSFDELAHSDLFRLVASGEVECDTGIPACKINPPVTMFRTIPGDA